MSFGLSLLPLLSGKVDINAITIVKPHIVYAIGANGESNWTMTAATPSGGDSGNRA